MEKNKDTLFRSRKYGPTPAGICEAARYGDVRSIELILTERPDLLLVDNPHNWSKCVPKHERRGAHFKKPVEVAAFFDQAEAVKTLLEFSRYSIAIGKPWSKHRAFDGHFNSLRIAETLEHQTVIDTIFADVRERVQVDPELLNYHEDDGKTLLHYAAEQRCLALFEWLLNQGANPKVVQANGRSAMHCLLDEPHSEKRNRLAVRMIEMGVENDLWVATVLNDEQRVREQLEEDSSRANQHFRPDRAKLSDGFPLVRAAANGNLRIVELLLDAGANINATNHDTIHVENEIKNSTYNDVPNEFGMALLAAVYTHHYHVAEVLLDRGASPHAYANCADPLADMLYKAHFVDGPDWLALGELQHVTEDRRSHLQPSRAGSTEIIRLHQRVKQLGGEHQIYSVVAANQYQEIDRLLSASGENARTFRGKASVLHAVSDAAAWGGNFEVMQKCLLHPTTPDQASQRIATAIRSHNRNCEFAEYRDLIRGNLEILKQSDAPITCDPLGSLSIHFLENYNYGLHDQLPTVADMVELAKLFLEYGADINQRNSKTHRTPLAEAVNQGHEEYVEFLILQGATVERESPASTNPVSIARKHGFTRILEMLGEDVDEFVPLKHPLERRVVKPTSTEPPIAMAPLCYARIDVGTATISTGFSPFGEDGDTQVTFVAFENDYPDEQFAHVRMLVSNQNYPQIVASITTCSLNGRQGFLLKARNTMPGCAVDALVEEPVSFSWMAVLLTDQPQLNRFEIRCGLLPQCEEFDAYKLHRYQTTESLFEDTPLRSSENAHVFLTSTELQAVINGAAFGVTPTGIARIEARNTTRHGSDARLYWMVVSPIELASLDDDVASQPDEELWLFAGRAGCKLFSQGAAMSRWAHQAVSFPLAFLERKPCVFASSNSHSVDHHHASTVAMTWECTSMSFAVKGHSFDEHAGECSFDCIAVGHLKPSQDSVLTIAAPREPWERFLATDGDEGTNYEMAVSGAIGLNAFGPDGGSLLMHAVDERFETMNTSLAIGLIKLGADANLRHPETGLSPLHVAAFRGRLWMTRLLLDHGAEIDVRTVPGTRSTFPTSDFWFTRRQRDRTHKGETPLHLAVLHRNWEVARLLACAGANINSQDILGDRPIDYVPRWATFPDDLLHWQVINHEVELTTERFLRLLEILKNG